MKYTLNGISKSVNNLTFGSIDVSGSYLGVLIYEQERSEKSRRRPDEQMARMQSEKPRAKARYTSASTSILIITRTN
jgi:hypothetical protein